MASKVGVLQADQSRTDEPTFHVKHREAERWVRRLIARRISRFLIQLVALNSAAAIQATTPGFSDGPMGVGNLLPFYKVQNPLMQPERLHYVIPACGARRRLLSCKKTNYLPEAWA